ncbi:Hypothetical predicted protein [Octopus vulgaris]|uniref:Uncharacterized protein n=1 Tax=Octopus vulgaris TaxID=6645 RepID=A0AA36BLS9_OCTVU|nr:Hypothetical predicted protein [Octopus vulgaris]
MPHDILLREKFVQAVELEVMDLILKRDSKCFYQTSHECAKFYDKYIHKACHKYNNSNGNNNGYNNMIKYDNDNNNKKKKNEHKIWLIVPYGAQIKMNIIKVILDIIEQFIHDNPKYKNIFSRNKFGVGYSTTNSVGVEMKESCTHQFEQICNYPHWTFKAI